MMSFWGQSSTWVLILAALSCARAVQGGNYFPDNFRSKSAATVESHTTTENVGVNCCKTGGTCCKTVLRSNIAGRFPGKAEGDSSRRLGKSSVEANEILRTRTKPINEWFPFAALFGPTCGATIISPNWVITAAHCLLFSSGRYILAGTNNTIDGSGERVRVKRLVLHPLFSVGPHWVVPQDFGIKQVAARFDFLLAELERPLKLDGKRLEAAKLDYEATIPPGLDVAYAGFGAAHHGESMRSEMHAMELETMPDELCADRLPQYDAQNMLCARGIPPRFDSACNGDSGSGLVHKGHLLGVTSWVEDDATSCYPGALVVFAKIARVRDWIRETTGV